MKISTRDIILIGLFAALMAVGAYIKVPNPFNPAVPITFQLFFCIYSGVLLGSKKGLASQLIYIAIGLIGVPVFAGGGGFGYVASPTFGYILGFAVCAFVVGYIVEGQTKIGTVTVTMAAIAGLLANYLIGNTWFWAIQTGGRSWLAVGAIMLPYMIKDLVLAVVIAATATSILPVVRKAEQRA